MLTAGSVILYLFYVRSNAPLREGELKRGDDTTHFSDTAGAHSQLLTLTMVGLTQAAEGGRTCSK